MKKMLFAIVAFTLFLSPQLKAQIRGCTAEAILSTADVKASTLTQLISASNVQGASTTTCQIQVRVKQTATPVDVSIFYGTGPSCSTTSKKIITFPGVPNLTQSFSITGNYKLPANAALCYSLSNVLPAGQINIFYANQ